MMEYGPAIMMLVFAGALLLYAALLAITKDYDLLPRRATSPVRPKNSRKYTFQLSKVLALTALCPALTALACLFSGLAAVLVFILSLILCLWKGTKIMKEVL